MENPQVQPTTVDTRVKGDSKKGKKREFKNRKTFSLKSMEALVDRIAFLKNKYDALAINAQEKLGYHYNEILNILLFHKYVKSNKKLFDMYKKIKDRINKGYEFDKKKKVQENTMKKMMKENKASHFAINKKTNKILESWNYNGYEQNELNAHKHEYFTKDLNRNYPFLNENDIVVVSAKNLQKRELNENSKKNWQKYNYSHFALLKETNHILYGYDYSDVDKNELTENKNEYFLNILSEVYGSDISAKDVVVVKANKLNKLGIKDYLNESNWVGLINEAYCGSNMEEELNEGSSYVEYDSERAGEEPFMLHGEKWQFVNAIYSDGKKDIGVYRYKEDLVYSYDWFRRAVLNDKTMGDSELDEDVIDESTSMGGGAGVGVFGAEGPPVMAGTFDLSQNQDMFKPPRNMKPSVRNGIKRYQSEYSNPTFNESSEPEFIEPVKTTHVQGTKIKAMKENYDLVDLDALMNDEIIEYKKINAEANVFKSPKIELIRENNRDSITDFIVKHQGNELPEYYNKRQLNNLSLKTLNEYYNRLVQRLGLLGEEKKPEALLRIDALKKQSQNDSNSYYKKDASTKTTTMLVQKGEGDGLVYDKDSRQRKDIPKYEYQSEAQKEYLEKIHRGLEDVQPENGPNGEVDAKWEARKKALMSTQEVGAKAYDSAKKRIQYKNDNKLGTGRGRAVLNQETLPKVDKKDKVLKENSFTVLSEENILNQIQSYYIDDENRKKPVIFDSNNIIEMNKINENKLVGCKELIYKGLGQTLSENFKNKLVNKKLLYSPDSKKVFLV
jgi:hypothetical protein